MLTLNKAYHIFLIFGSKDLSGILYRLVEGSPVTNSHVHHCTVIWSEVWSSVLNTKTTRPTIK